MGAACESAGSTLGMAAWWSDGSKARIGAGPVGRRVALWSQEHLPRDDLVRRGAILSHAVWSKPAGWG